jgi:hypothetical protein
MSRLETSTTCQRSESLWRHLPMLGKRDFSVITQYDPVLITDAFGFRGSRVLWYLLDRGFRNLISFPGYSSCQFLPGYMEHATPFKSIYARHQINYAPCYFWQECSRWTEEQLLPAFNRRRWHVDWLRTRYCNKKMKTRLGRMSKVPTKEGLQMYIEACGRNGRYA